MLRLKSHNTRGPQPKKFPPMGVVIFVFFMMLLVFWKQDIKHWLGIADTHSDIENMQSSLLPFLLTKDDFPEEWGWDHIYTQQYEQIPSEKNNFLIEGASALFSGSLRSYGVVVIERIYVYQEQPQLENESGTVDRSQKFIVDMVEQLSEYGDVQEFSCEYDVGDHICTIRMRSNEMEVQLMFFLDATAPQDTFENHLKTVLDKLLYRLRDGM